MPTKMTSAAWSRGFKNAMICLVGLVVSLGALTSVISVIFQQPMRDSVGKAYIIFWVIIIPAFFFSWLYGKRQSGALLLDCGPHPARKLSFIYAVFFLLMSVGSRFGFVPSNLSISGIRGDLFGITCSAFFLIMAFGRLQIREHGIWQYWGLLKWRKIENYYWEGDTDLTLMMQTKTKFPIFGRGALPVPIENRIAIDELIKKNIAIDT